ncbi:hypothetical protein BDY17DRAFT_124439 [Neohortaea acidophila]|uniref:Uncharacterized protein n=1 Tax=Neohortaea acidophila TaxID=245834 RepID=A0A6A6PW78_9PEZI|nr:uncharacterized protein BDY17DRAFT_124439 [Neohortaea acidophila]KAF2484235.1 hypothetical protein BDY17DRAFT_124439 [Neohortaea acidophila]
MCDSDSLATQPVRSFRIRRRATPGVNGAGLPPEMDNTIYPRLLHSHTMAGKYPFDEPTLRPTYVPHPSHFKYILMKQNMTAPYPLPPLPFGELTPGSQATYPTSTRVVPTQTGVPPTITPRGIKDFDVVDWLEPDSYIDVPCDAYTTAINKLTIAGPVYRNKNGDLVWFDDVEWDEQVRLLTAMSMPIIDKAAFIKAMGAGNPQSATGPGQIGAFQAQALSIPNVDGAADATGTAEEQERSGKGVLEPGGCSNAMLLDDDNPRKDSLLLPTPLPKTPPSQMNPQALLQVMRSASVATTRGFVATNPHPDSVPRKGMANSYERIGYGDVRGCTIRRQMPGIEWARHASKMEVSLEMHLMLEFGVEKCFRPRVNDVRAEQSRWATLGRARRARLGSM